MSKDQCAVFAFTVAHTRQPPHHCCRVSSLLPTSDPPRAALGLMASAIHAPATQLPPPSLSRPASSYSLSLGHLQLSPQSSNPFQPSPSNARTPSETPPPSRQMSFSMNYPNGVHTQSSGPRSFMENNEYLVPRNSYSHKPSIYTVNHFPPLPCAIAHQIS